jgi:hypothetical protein
MYVTGGDGGEEALDDALERRHVRPDTTMAALTYVEPLQYAPQPCHPSAHGKRHPRARSHNQARVPTSWPT